MGRGELDRHQSSAFVGSSQSSASAVIYRRVACTVAHAEAELWRFALPELDFCEDGRRLKLAQRFSPLLDPTATQTRNGTNFNWPVASATLASGTPEVVVFNRALVVDKIVTLVKPARTEPNLFRLGCIGN